MKNDKCDNCGARLNSKQAQMYQNFGAVIVSCYVCNSYYYFDINGNKIREAKELEMFVNSHSKPKKTESPKSMIPIGSPFNQLGRRTNELTQFGSLAVLTQKCKLQKYRTPNDFEILEINGKMPDQYERTYDKIINFILSPDESKIIYSASRYNLYFIILNDQEFCLGSKYLSGALFSLNSEKISLKISYADNSGSEIKTISNLEDLNNKEGFFKYKSILSNTMVFSNDNNRFGFVANHDIYNERMVIVVDGEEIKEEYFSVRDLAFSENNKHFMYIASKRESFKDYFLYIDRNKIRKVECTNSNYYDILNEEEKKIVEK